jgi:8-oxo-dGTP diphosphatase
MADSARLAPLTHRVAVGAYIFFGDRVLLLMRVNPPRTFAPPGGRLNESENPIDGLRREVMEETALTIRIVGVAHTWFGSTDGRNPPLIGIDYLADCEADTVTLSGEHTDYVWASREDLASGLVPTLTLEGYGYQPQYILEAFDLYERLRSRMR